MRALVIRGFLIIVVLIVGYFIVIDQEKTRFYINNRSDIENLKVTVSDSEQLIFHGNVNRNLVTHRYSKKQKVRLGNSDIIYLRVSLPNHGLFKEVMLYADDSDYILININRLLEDEYTESISVTSLTHDYVRTHMVPGL